MSAGYRRLRTESEAGLARLTSIDRWYVISHAGTHTVTRFDLWGADWCELIYRISVYLQQYISAADNLLFDE